MTQTSGAPRLGPVQVAAVVTQLRLDALALAASSALSAARVPHAVIKGVTTSVWLYDPPRPYADVDLLVPVTRVKEAIDALVSAGLAQATQGRVGEESSHSVVLTSRQGLEIDLHVNLPSLPTPADDMVWDCLAGHLCEFRLGAGAVPALDPVGRTLVLALHVVTSGDVEGVVREDFRRARARLTDVQWDCLVRLAGHLGLADHLDAARRVVDGIALDDLDPELRLRLSGAIGPAVQWERLRRLPFRRWPRELAQEVAPSRAALLRRYPDLAGRRLPYLRAVCRRWAWLLRTTPLAIRQVKAIHGVGDRPN